MATSNKAVVVIVGGGWHTPDNYGKLVKALQAAGHEVHCPRHPSLDQVRPPTAGLAGDSQHLRAHVEGLVDSGRRVVALMHSYGGQVGTDALHGLGLESRSQRGLPGGVSDLVYMCAFALPEGGSMAAKVKDMGHEALMLTSFDFEQDMTVLCRDPGGQLVGADADPQELEAYLGALVRWNGRCLYDGVGRCAWREVPVTYIYAMDDLTVPLDYQRSMVAFLEEQGCGVQTYELATGHCPNLTATDGVVDVVNRVVG